MSDVQLPGLVQHVLRGQGTFTGSPTGLVLRNANGVTVYEVSPSEPEKAKTLCKVLLAGYGVEILTVYHMIYTSSREYYVNRKPWVVYPLTNSSDIPTPRRVCQRIEFFQAKGIQFNAFVLAEELALPRPKMIKPLPISLDLDFLDPHLLGIMRLGKDDGVWCRLGKWNH